MIRTALKIVLCSFFYYLPIVLFASDTLCKQTIFKKMFTERATYAVFDYVDSAGKLHHYIQNGPRLYDEISKRYNISYKESREMILSQIEKGNPLQYSQFGDLGGAEIKNKKYVDRWIKKGRKKYLRHFFESNKRRLKDKYNYTIKPDFMEVMYIGYHLGLVIEENEGNQLILYKSDCDRID